MLADSIKATESRIKQLESRYLKELSEAVDGDNAILSAAEPEAFRSAARLVAYMTSVELEKERHTLIDQLYARLRELESQLDDQGKKANLPA